MCVGDVGTKEDPISLHEARSVVVELAKRRQPSVLLVFKMAQLRGPVVGFAREVNCRTPVESDADSAIAKHLAATAMQPGYSGQAAKLYRDIVLGTRAKHETNVRSFLHQLGHSELLSKLVEFETLRTQVKQRVPTRKSVMSWVRKWRKMIKELEKRKAGAGAPAAVDDGGDQGADDGDESTNRGGDGEANDDEEPEEPEEEEEAIDYHPRPAAAAA